MDTWSVYIVGTYADDDVDHDGLTYQQAVAVVEHYAQKMEMHGWEINRTIASRDNTYAVMGVQGLRIVTVETVREDT